MDEIRSAEYHLTIQNLNMDFFKSQYMLTAQKLIVAIIKSPGIGSPESEEKIKNLTSCLVNSKKELIESIDEYIEIVEVLSCEVETYLWDVKNVIQ